MPRAKPANCECADGFSCRACFDAIGPTREERERDNRPMKRFRFRISAKRLGAIGCFEEFTPIVEARDSTQARDAASLIRSLRSVR